MDPLASGLAVSGAGIKVANVVKKLYRDYGDAPKNISHAQRKGQQLHINQDLLNKLPESKKKRFEPAHSSLNDIRVTAPASLQPERKRDRLKWSLAGKSRFDRENALLQGMEVSVILTILSSYCEDM